MPIARFQMPDGRIGRFEVPEGTTPDQAQLLIQSSIAEQPVSPSVQPVQPATSNSSLQKITNPDNSFVGNLLGGITEPILQQATGMVAKPLGELAGMGAGIADMIAGRAIGGMDATDVKNKVQQALTYQPQTSAGKSDYNPLNFIPRGIGAVIGGIANPIADAIGNGAESTSARKMISDATREAIPQAIGIGLAKLSSKPSDALAAKQAKLDVLKKQNAATDAVINQGRSAGFKFTPDELSKFGAGHPIGSSMEDIAALHVYHLNKEANALAMAASMKNYRNSINLIRDDLKLPNGDPLPSGTSISTPVINQFIKQHGGSYDAVSAIKDPIPYTPEYISAVKNLEGDLSAAKAQYPDLMKTDGVSQIQEALLNGNSTNAAAAIQLIRKLRDTANRVLSSNEPKPEAFALAKIQKKSANVVEDLLGQYLKDSGKNALFDAFQNSRTQIAKAYAIKNALDDGTVLSTSKLARNGDALTGNLKIIADMKKQHPNLMLDPRTISTKGGGLGSSAVVGAGVALSGFPGVGAAIAARPLMNPLLLSDTYQSLFSNTPSYVAKPSLLQQTGGMLSSTIPYQVDKGQQK